MLYLFVNVNSCKSTCNTQKLVLFQPKIVVMFRARGHVTMLVAIIF